MFVWRRGEGCVKWLVGREREREGLATFAWATSKALALILSFSLAEAKARMTLQDAALSMLSTSCFSSVLPGEE